MADAEARVAITATDQTAAAFNSASRNLVELERGMRGIRKAFDVFGVAFTAQAFAGWIKGALDAKNMTDEQIASMKTAKAAFESFKESSDDLARSFATALAPAIDLVGKGLVGLNHAFFGANAAPLEKQANDLRTQITILKAQLGSSGGMGKTFLDELREKIAKAEADLADLNKRQLDALTGGPKDKLQEFQKGDLVSVANQLKQIHPFEQDVSAGQKLSPQLEEFIAELKQAQKITEDLNGEVGKQIEQWHEMQLLFKNGIIDQKTLDEFRDGLLQPIEVTQRHLKLVKDETLTWAKELGGQFRNAFSGWIAGGETDFKNLLKRLAAELFTSALFKGLASMFTGSTSTWGQLLGSFFGGGKAAGGPLEQGKWYIAGEHGPEPIWGGGAGAFAAGYGGGGGINFAPVYNIDARGADQTAIGGVRAMLVRNNQELKAEIADLIRRNRFAK